MAMEAPTLPVEIVSQIARYSNLHGDTGNFRLANSFFDDIAAQQARLYLADTCAKYGISARSLALFSRHNDGRHELANALKLDGFLRRIQIIAVEADKALAPRAPTAAPGHSTNQREALLLFSAFSQTLRASTAIVGTCGDILGPSGDSAVENRQFSSSFRDFLDHDLTLSELESIIGAINICATRLWSTIFLFGPKNATVSSFGSLSGHSFNTEQAILTEHVIWRGPEWVSRTLETYHQLQSGSLPSPKGNGPADNILSEGAWRGSREDGARLAANGLARTLWRQRQQKIEEAAARTAPEAVPKISEMRVNVVVWRGSAGDM